MSDLTGAGGRGNIDVPAFYKVYHLFEANMLHIPTKYAIISPRHKKGPMSFLRETGPLREATTLDQSRLENHNHKIGVESND